jgi:activator of Hsp90 ATPase-like protein
LGQLTLPAISKHIKVLERAGMVVRVSSPSTGRARWTLRELRRSRLGRNATGQSGRPASTGWTPTSDNSGHPEGQASAMTDNGSADAVVIERIVDAPLALVWRMWTDPEHFRAWYGWAMALGKLGAYLTAYSDR